MVEQLVFVKEECIIKVCFVLKTKIRHWKTNLNKAFSGPGLYQDLTFGAVGWDACTE